MLISSKFHDYYDTISVYGIDKTCVYRRTTKTLDGAFSFDDASERHSWWRNRWPHSCEYIKNNTTITFSYFVMGFCGKLYPFVQVERSDKKLFFYNVEDLYEHVAKLNINLDNQRFYRSFNEFSVRSPESMVQFFEGNLFKGLEGEFQKNNCPTFIYGRFPHEKRQNVFSDKIVLNPRLMDYKFVKVKDPATAFQDIFMFISGVLGVLAPETVELTDKELAKKKGHDSKYSFRKPPGKRGKKQWR